MTGTGKTKVWIEEKQQIAVRDLFSEARHQAWARGEDDPGIDYEADGFCLPEHAEGETFSHVGPLGIENDVITVERLRELEPDSIIIVTDEDVEAFRKRLFGEEEQESKEEDEESSSSDKDQENEQESGSEEKSGRTVVEGKVLVKNLDQIRDDGIAIDRYNGGWLKRVTGLNKERLNGYSIEGEFVKPPFYCVPGDVILDCSKVGSRKHVECIYTVMRVREDGHFEEVGRYDAGEERRGWAPEVWPFIEEALGQERPNPLAAFSDEELLAEVRRRGLLADTISLQV